MLYLHLLELLIGLFGFLRVCFACYCFQALVLLCLQPGEWGLVYCFGEGSCAHCFFMSVYVHVNVNVNLHTIHTLSISLQELQVL